MAHADYECCAICDCKIRYAAIEDAKTDICMKCMKVFRNKGLNIIGTEELINWLKTENKEKIREILKEANFEKCCYLNLIDDLVGSILSK